MWAHVMEYIITIERGGTLWLCLDEEDQLRKLNYMMAALSFVGGDLQTTKEMILDYHPRFVIAPKSIKTVETFLIPRSKGTLLIHGVKQRVVALDRNILLLPHLDFQKVLKKSLDCI